MLTKRRVNPRSLLSRVLNRMLRPLGLAIVRVEQRDQSDTAWLYASRRALTALDHTISAGPFCGTQIAPVFSWNEAPIGAIVIGSYESQLHDVLEELISSTPDLIINIGAAEGLYAVGLARRLPNSRVVAVDITEESESAVRANSILNGVENRVTARLNLDPEQLEQLLRASEAPVIVMDCEGCERVMLDPLRVPTLHRTKILVELHEFVEEGIGSLIRSRLKETHAISEIVDGPRNPSDFPSLSTFGPAQQWLLMCEGRPAKMSWLWCLPFSRSD